jgi:FAD/FMN-containing dehydrogenase
MSLCSIIRNQAARPASGGDDMNAVDGSANELTARLARLLPPDVEVAASGPAYEASCALWNGAVSHRPAAVLSCSQVADVQAGVRAARELGLPLSVRAGGHGWTGTALADGGLTLDISAMRGVLVDPRTDVADVQVWAT